MKKSRCVLSILLMASCLVAFTPHKSISKTWLINSLGTGDAATIQAGIDSAITGDIVSLENGTYSFTGNRDIDFRGKAITVQSQSGDPALCIVNIDGNATNPHFGFQFSSGETETSVLSGITIEGGYYFSGGILIDDASPTITNCVFFDNTATVGGGAIGIGMGAPLITYCMFENNSAQVGGAVFCNNALPTFQHCEFKSDSATASGGAFASEHGSPTLENCRFLNNWAGESGGAISCFYDDDFTLTDLFLSGNEAELVGGGMSLEDNVGGEVSGCTLTVNTAQAGGGVYVAGNATIRQCTMYENSATQSGGAIVYAGGLLEVTDCTLSANSAVVGGGMTCFDDQPVAVTNTIIVFSTQGEAIFGTGGARVDLYCCDVYGNAGGDWVGPILGQDALPGNFSADPAFCGVPGTGNFELQSDSPCAPGNHPKGTGCGQIGARPVGCTTSPVRNATLGEIKSIFRNRK